MRFVAVLLGMLLRQGRCVGLRQIEVDNAGSRSYLRGCPRKSPRIRSRTRGIRFAQAHRVSLSDQTEDRGVHYTICWLAADMDGCWVHETAPGDGLAPVSALSDWSGEDLERIRAVLQRLTLFRVENEADAEDLVQETLLTMTVKCPASGPDKGLLIWGMGILRRKIGNYYRRVQRYVPIDGEEIDSPSRLAISPERRYLQSELIGLVDRTLHDMPERQRQAMELCLAGLPAHEIADALRPERYQNVINRLFRGRRKVAAQLRAYGCTAAIVPPQRKSDRRGLKDAGGSAPSPGG